MLTDQHFGKVAAVFEQVEGFEGSGYDWASVAHAVVGRDAQHLEGRFGTDPKRACLLRTAATTKLLVNSVCFSPRRIRMPSTSADSSLFPNSTRTPYRNDIGPTPRCGADTERKI